MSEYDQWVAWTRDRDARIGAEYGPLSLTALHWLDETPTVYAPVPGTWSADAHDITVSATAADGLSFDHNLVDGTKTMTASGADVRGRFGDHIVEVIRRDGAAAIRVRDPHSPARLGFTTQPRYGFDPAWRLMGTFEPYERLRIRAVSSVVDGVNHRAHTAGEVVFTAAGENRRLVVFTDEQHTSWSILFRDLTSGATTAASARSLTVAAPKTNGAMVVDFNRAANLPCAYNDYSTCPIPLPENRLDIQVTAGERLPW